MLLDKMKGAGFNFSRVVALTGDGQVCLIIYIPDIRIVKYITIFGALDKRELCI